MRRRERGGRGGRGGRETTRLFQNPNIIDAFLAQGDYKSLNFGSTNFGMGFQLFPSSGQPEISGESISAARKFGQDSGQPKTFGEKVSAARPAFGHAGLGGSVGFCDPNFKFSIAITLNKLSQNGEVPGGIVRLVCTELGIPVPEKFKSETKYGADMMGQQVV